MTQLEWTAADLDQNRRINEVKHQLDHEVVAMKQMISDLSRQVLALQNSVNVIVDRYAAMQTTFVKNDLLHRVEALEKK